MSLNNATIDTYLRYLSEEKNYSPHTVLNYSIDLKAFHTYMTEQYEVNGWQAVQELHLRSYIASCISQQCAVSSIRRKKSSIQSFYKWMMIRGMVQHNPAALLKTPKLPKRLPTALEPHAVDSLIIQQESIVNTEDWQEYNASVISTLLFETGMRRMELCLLTEDDFLPQRGVIQVLGKGGKERQIPLRPDTIRLLKEYLQHKSARWGHNNALLITPSGRAVYPQYVYRIIKAQLASISHHKKKSPHVLRHTFATTLLNNGADIKAIQDLLGHSSLAATQVYTHTNIDQLKKEFRKSHPRN